MSFKECPFLAVVFIWAAVTLTNVSTSVANRPKRSDDVDPLKAVVEQLTRQVTSLSTQLTQQGNTSNVHLNAVNTEVTALKRKTDSLDQKVAFYAWNSVNPVQATAHGTLILNHAGTNIGNAYNTRTGIFTAPVSGLYYFQTTFLSYRLGSGKQIHSAIYVDSQKLAEGISDTNHGHYDQTTINTIVHVTHGQEVCVRNMETTAKEYFDAITDQRTTFSGFLINAD